MGCIARYELNRKGLGVTLAILGISSIIQFTETKQSIIEQMKTNHERNVS
jgi:hypothetical protein